MALLRKLMILLGFLTNISTSSITTITSSNVDEILKKEKFSLVLFYAPWQKECKEKVKLIKELRKMFQGRENELYFGLADVYNDLKLATKFRIEDYCVLKYFIKGSDVPESYERNFNIEDVKAFIERTSDIDISNDDFKQPLIEVDNESFDRYVKDKERTALVLFHAKWCKKCEQLLETMRHVARNFKKLPNCVLAHMDGEDNYDTAIKENIGIYPSFKFYPISNKDGEKYLPGKYEERWSVKNITKFMSIHCKTKMADDHVMDKMIGRIKDLDILTRHFIMREGNHKEQERIVRDTVLKIQQLAPFKRYSADYYVETMRQILKEGESYLDEEIMRFDKILLTEMMEKHKDEMSEKRNILNHFRSHRRDEL